MSISQPKVSNPCKKFIEFKADAGVFRFWNKEEKKNVEIPYPIRFIVLDELNTIKGFCDQTHSGIYSNEVHSLKHQELHVKTFKGNVSVNGIYEEIKARILDLGGKFCKSIYVGLINGEDLELANFQLTGASFKAWIDKELDASTQVVSVSDCTDCKKGKVQYKSPNWKGLAMPSELRERAVSLDKELQQFLKSRAVVEADSKKEGVQAAPEHEDQEIPF